MESVSRRSFVKSAGAAGLGIAAASMLAKEGRAEEVVSGMVSPTNIPDEWDYETDIAIIGFGGAGANAAIAAAYAGVDALVVEVAPEKYAGGNTAVAGGGMVKPNDMQTYIDHLEAACFGNTPHEYLEKHAEALDGILDWLDELGLTYKMRKENYGHFLTTGDAPEVVSSLAGDTLSGLDSYSIDDDEGNSSFGSVLFALFKRIAVEDEGIEVLYETRAQMLYQDAATREIRGVMCTDKDGNVINIKARKGVILACGGFENNQELIDTHIRPGAHIYPTGTPYNRGDGVFMAQEVGCKMWHMDGIEWNGYGPRVLNYGDTAGSLEADVVVCSHWNLDPHIIIVNQYGYRFFPENRSLNHTKEMVGLDFKGYADTPNELYDYPGRIAWVVFDQKRFDEQADTDGAGEIYQPTFTGPTGVVGSMGFVQCLGLYEWDSEQAIKDGLLLKADTLDELIEQMGIVYGDNLKETIATYNAHCEAGETDEFGRDPETMQSIDTPPYYAVSVYPSFINTQGGPVHDNLSCRCIDNRGQEIPRLYATGECGSVYSLMYHGSGNITEAVVTGKNAAQDAAELEDWDA